MHASELYVALRTGIVKLCVERTTIGTGIHLSLVGCVGHHLDDKVIKVEVTLHSLVLIGNGPCWQVMDMDRDIRRFLSLSRSRWRAVVKRITSCHHILHIDFLRLICHSAVIIVILVSVQFLNAWQQHSWQRTTVACRKTEGHVVAVIVTTASIVVKTHERISVIFSDYALPWFFTNVQCAS